MAKTNTPGKPHTHISLIGAQPVPVYNVLLYAKANKAFLVHSADTVAVAQNIKAILGEQCFLKPIEKPFDFEACRSFFLQLVLENPGNSFSFNITGGTKIMTIAALEVAKKLKVPAFFIDQNNVITNITGEKSEVYNTPVPLGIHLKLFGQSATQSTKFETIDKAMFDYARKIWSEFESFQKMFKQFRYNEYNENHSFIIKNKQFELGWNAAEKLVVFFDDETGYEEQIGGFNVFNIFFQTAWFEIYVLENIAQWKQAKQLYWNTVIPQTTKELAKNEIDIIIDTGVKLFFIECKTHVHDIKDLDKFRNVVKNFGGLAAKAILVTRLKPSDTILEKCADNKISVFWFYDEKHKNIRSNGELIDLLNKEYLIINPI